MDIEERPPQPVLVARHRDDVHVVGHQAIGPDRHPRSRRRVGQQVEVEFVVAVLEEHLLAAIAALRHVVLDARQDEAGKTGRSFRLASLAV